MHLKEFITEVINIAHNEHPIIMLINNILIGLSQIWNYPVFITQDQQTVAVSNIFVGIVLLMAGLKLAKYLSKKVGQRLTRTKTIDASIIISLERISHYLFIAIFTIFVMEAAHLPLTALTVVGTTLALGIGLGSQNIANNFISGLIILIERPIKLGDIIEIKNLNVVGEVINIGARCVSLRAQNNINVLIPNSAILQDSLINWTLDDKRLKLALPIFLDACNEFENVDKILYQIAASHSCVLNEPGPKVLVKSIGKTLLTIELEFWINLGSQIDSRYIINDINREIKELFKVHDIKLGDDPHK